MEVCSISKMKFGGLKDEVWRMKFGGFGGYCNKGTSNVSLHAVANIGELCPS